MDPYPFGDENALHLEMLLPGFPESQGLLCGEALDHDLCLSARDVLYAGLSGTDVVLGLPDADTAARAPEPDLNAFSLSPAKDSDSVRLLEEPDSPPPQHEPRLPAPAAPEEPGGGRRRGGGGEPAGRGRRPLGSPRASAPGCGKVFGSAGALGKHRRAHVCAACGRAFKRPDHLSSHVLTHQKRKPFACPERGCHKSYCDHRSLRRHRALRHGSAGAPKEAAGEGSPLPPSPSIRGPFPPTPDPLRCAVSSSAQQELPSSDSSPANRTSCLVPASSGLPEAAEDDRWRDPLLCPTAAASPDLCAAVNPGDVSVVALDEDTVTNLTGSSFISEARHPAGLRGCPGSTAPPSPASGGQKASANRWSGDFQRMRKAPVCAEPNRDSVCLAGSPPAVAQGVPEGFSAPSRPFPAAHECPDALSFPAAPFEAEEEVLSDSALRYSEESFQSAQPHDSHLREDAGELSFPEVGKHDAPQNETCRLFPKSREPPRLQQHLFGAVTESRHVLADARVPAPSPLAAPDAEHLPVSPFPAEFRQQPPSAPQPTEYHGPFGEKTVPRFQDVLSDGEEQGARAAPAFQSPVEKYVGLRGSSVPAQLRYAMPGIAMGSRSSGRWNQLENPTAALKEQSKDRSGEAGAGRSWRLPAVRPEPEQPPGFGQSRAALASPAPAPAAGGTRRLTIFNRIQGGNIYSLVTAAKEGNPSAACDRAGAAPAAGGGWESGALRQSCGSLPYPENGPESCGCFRAGHRCSPPRREEQQVGDGNAGNPPLRAAGDGNRPSKPAVASEDVAVAPLVIPVSVPATDSQGGSEVTAEQSPDGRDHDENPRPKKRKRQTRPQPLFIPPPPVPGAQPGMGGCYRSNLRSPVFLVDHLLRDLFQRSPYTPPPMLSPIREGSGLYFSTLCSSSAGGDPDRLLSAVAGRTDGDFGLRLLKDNARIGVRPHINVGSRFQAEVPNLRDRSWLEKEEQVAALVWKPWGDIATNPETQHRVTELLDTACSSVMPGGGTNLELALHCLHEARGSVLEALELLLFGEAQRSESHPLANYRYAGSDTWTPLEQQLFKKAFFVHKKDFSLIQKEIQTKNVSQCVEYYYIWKKKWKFSYSRAEGIGKKVERDAEEVEETEEKAVFIPKEKQKGYKKVPPPSREIPSCDPGASPCPSGRAEQRGVFPCGQCGRVFDKIKGRNAHMKSHRRREQPEPLLKSQWPWKCFRSEAKWEGTQALSAPDGNWEAVDPEEQWA